MITKETAVKIWNAHNEIENCDKLIQDMGKLLMDDKDKKEPTLYNAFGERRGLELGVPSGKDSHRIFGVNADLGVKIIETHRSDMAERLKELMAIAKIELATI